MIGNGAINNSITKNWLDTLERGTIFAYSSNGTAPDGALICNGSAVSRTTYNLLFADIGTTYGAGDGSTTFNLPNLTNKFIQGNGTAGTVKSAGLPNITGNVQGGFYSGPADGAFSLASKYNTQSGGSSDQGKFNFNASRSSSIYGNSSTVQPPALTMKFYIKY